MKAPINTPLQSHSIVALAQERTSRDRYKIAASAIVRPTSVSWLTRKWLKHALYSRSSNP